MSRQMGLENYYESDYSEGCNGALMEQLRELLEINGNLHEEVDKLNGKIKDQNEMIEEQLGKDIEIRAKGKFNNAGDSVQPTSLSNKVMEIFDNEWRNAMISVFRGDKELVGIRFLSNILQDCQLFCQEKAREHLLKFVNPCSENMHCTVEEVILSKGDRHSLYKLRRITGLHERNRLNVINLFAKECREKEVYRDLEEYDINKSNCHATRDVNGNGKGQGVKTDAINNGKGHHTKDIVENDKSHGAQDISYNGKGCDNKKVDEVSGKRRDAKQCLIDYEARDSAEDNGKGCKTNEDKDNEKARDEKDASYNQKGCDAKDVININKCYDVKKYGINRREELKCIDDYISSCCDICWQCAISDPPVLLKFDVIGEKFQIISDKFQQYHYNGALDEQGVSNEVMQVVWPAVVIHNNEENIDILVDNAKGSVLLYQSSAL